MKARVKATGYIIDVELYYITPRIKTYTDGSQYYNGDELDFNVNYDSDYWTRLEHTYAGMAMQGMLNNSLLITGLLKVNKSHEDIVAEVTGTAIRYAHALVEKMKEERK